MARIQQASISLLSIFAEHKFPQLAERKNTMLQNLHPLQ